MHRPYRLRQIARDRHLAIHYRAMPFLKATSTSSRLNTIRDSSIRNSRAADNARLRNASSHLDQRCHLAPPAVHRRHPASSRFHCPKLWLPAQPDCWQKLNIMFDKGIRPSKSLLHAFFDGPAFKLHLQFPEYVTGVDRLLKLGVDINAPDQQGKTVLAKVMNIPVHPNTLQALLARGAKMEPSYAVPGATGSCTSRRCAGVGDATSCGLRRRRWSTPQAAMFPSICSLPTHPPVSLRTSRVRGVNQSVRTEQPT